MTTRIGAGLHKTAGSMTKQVWGSLIDQDYLAPYEDRYRFRVLLLRDWWLRKIEAEQ